jgi:hypothetical protein
MYDAAHTMADECRYSFDIDESWSAGFMNALPDFAIPRHITPGSAAMVTPAGAASLPGSHRARLNIRDFRKRTTDQSHQETNHEYGARILDRCCRHSDYCAYRSFSLGHVD